MLEIVVNRRDNQMQPHDIFQTPFALALGGGGARGLAHIGVLKALEREGIFPSLIVGSSMGAIIGAMYSQLRDSSHVEELIEGLLYRNCFSNLRLDLMPENSQSKKPHSKKHLVDYLRQGLYLSRVATRSGAIDNSMMIHILSRLLRDEGILDTQIPFAAVAVSLATGEEVMLQHGSIIRAVAASSAIPGVITPVEIDGDRLIDGSVVQVVPIQAAKSLSFYPVVAVDVSKDIAREAPPKTGLDVIIRADLIANRKLNMQALKDADIVLTPDVGMADWSDFHSIHRLISVGMESAERFLKQSVQTFEPVLVGIGQM
jgi:NTE family protein